MKVIKYEDIEAVLNDLELRSKIAATAIEWRQALLDGRFDKAADHRITLWILIDDYVRSHENTDNPSDTGVQPDGSGAADVVPD